MRYPARMQSDMVKQTQPGQRAVLLDIFRIILCIGVVVYHYTPERPSGGPYMVNGFFVMSGFLLGVSFLSGKAFDVCRFYGNKARRLLPMFLIALVLGFWYRVRVGNGALPHGPEGEWWPFYPVKWLSYYNTPLWYLAVEFVLLFMAPFFFFLFSGRWRLLLCTLGMALLTAFYFSCVPENAPFGHGLYYSPLARSWQFMSGIVAARFFHLIRRENLAQRPLFRWSTYGLFAIFFVLACVLSVVKQVKQLNYWNYTFEFDLYTTLFFALLVPLLFSQTPQVSPRVARGLAWCAALTYPVFLLHWAVYHHCCFYVWWMPKWGFSLTAAAITVLLSALLLRLEPRWLKWLGK